MQFLLPVGAAIGSFVVGFYTAQVLFSAPQALINCSPQTPLSKLSLQWNKRSIVMATSVIIVCWIPYIVMQFPGGISYDTYNQLYQFMVPAPTYYDTLDISFDAEYIDHHPVFDTLLFGSFFWLGSTLGNQQIGLFLYTLLQTIGTSCIFGTACCYLDRLGMPKVVRLVALVLFALFPFFPLWATNIIKDSLHAAIFTLFFLVYIETFRTRGTNLTQPSWMASLLLASFFCILTKKTGAVIVVPSLMVLAIYCCISAPTNKRIAVRTRILGCTLGIPIVALVLAPALIFPAIGGVAPGGTQEAFAIPLQQVTTVLRTHDDLSPEEKTAIEKVLDTQKALSNWEYSSADGVKSQVRANTSFQDWFDFVGTYFQIGLRHPQQYFTACLRISCDYFAPGTCMSYYRSAYHGWHLDTFTERFGSELQRGNVIFDFLPPQALSDANLSFNRTINDLASNPIFACLFSIGLWGGWIPMALILVAIVRDKRNAVVCVPLVLCLLACLLGPVAATRYMLPLLYTNTLMFGITCMPVRS